MVGGVIITHGGLADTIIEVAGSIAGKVENVKTVQVDSGDTTERIRQSLAGAVKDVNSGEGVIIFTDMFGGTPTNVALSLLKEGAVEIITGVNLPVVLKFISNRKRRKLQELAAVLRDHGTKSIVLAGEMLKAKE